MAEVVEADAAEGGFAKERVKAHVRFTDSIALPCGVGKRACSSASRRLRSCARAAAVRDDASGATRQVRRALSRRSWAQALAGSVVNPPAMVR